MSVVTADLVKALRERTSAGMLECKKALEASKGDIEAAIRAMREAGQAKAVKKAGRIAAEGTIVIAVAEHTQAAVMVEVNSETDFVAREERFKTFVRQVAQSALAARAKTLDGLLAAPYEGGTGHSVEQARIDLVAHLGENIQLRRMEYWEAREGTFIGHYAHGDANGIRIGALVMVKPAHQTELAHQLAMQVAGMRAEYARREDIPESRLQTEKDIIAAAVSQSDGDKPAAIRERIATGRLEKWISEVTLLGQAFVIRNPDETVAQTLKNLGAEVLAMARFEVGEGIEKQSTNFAEEVMSQASRTHA